MRETGTVTIITFAIYVVCMIFICGMLLMSDYSAKKVEAEQPKYFIEFEGKTYELNEVD